MVRIVHTIGSFARIGVGRVDWGQHSTPFQRFRSALWHIDWWAEQSQCSGHRDWADHNPSKPSHKPRSQKRKVLFSSNTQLLLPVLYVCSLKSMCLSVHVFHLSVHRYDWVMHLHTICALLYSYITQCYSIQQCYTWMHSKSFPNSIHNNEKSFFQNYFWVIAKQTIISVKL